MSTLGRGPLLALILGLAFLHALSGWLLTAGAGLAPQSALLNGLAALLSFPLQQLPEFFHASLARSLISTAVCSLLVVGSLVLALRGLHRKAGKRGLAWGWVALTLFIAAALTMLANPAPDWNQVGHRYLDKHYLMLPVPIQESQAEKAAAWQIHQNLWPDKPFKPASYRWYWKYSSSMAGHPTYDVVVVAAELDQAKDVQAFVELFDQQRDPEMRSGSWQSVQRNEQMAVETSIPNLAPITSTERNRISRAYTLQPAAGKVWIGILAKDRVLPREHMLRILDQAIESVRPMSGT